MFALWYFSLALDEARRRFNFIDKLFVFFNGQDSNKNKAITSTEPEPSKVEVKKEPVTPVIVPKQKPQEIIPEKLPTPAPVIPAKVVDDSKTKNTQKEEIKPKVVEKAITPEPVKLDVEEEIKSDEDSSPEKIVAFPSRNEDSFIFVENQKPKKPTSAKDLTMDFLKSETNRMGGVVRNKSDTMVDAAVLAKLEEGFAKLQASDSKSLLKKFLTKEVFDNLKNKKTSFNSTLLDCVQSGFENHDSGVGIYAPDAEAYSVFAELFDAVIEDYHFGFKKTDKHPASDFGDASVFGNLDPTGEFVVSTRVRCGRSMEGYPFNPCLTEAQYKEMEAKVSATLSGLDGELKGKFYPLTGMEKAVQQQLIDDHFLFKEGDRFLQAANACRYWPSGRGIYHNDNKTFLVWCNEEDHLRIISMQMGGDLGQVFRRLSTAVSDIEKRIPFSHHDRLGFLTFCPTNLGTTIRASVHIKVPKLSANYAKLEEVAGKYGLQVRGTRGEHTEAEGGLYDISNKRRMGLTEFQAAKEMYDGIAEIIKIEKSL